MFPNAHNGVKKLFTAEILDLLGVVAMTLAVIFATLFATAAAAESAGAAIGFGAALIVFGIGAGTLGIIATILTIVGLKRAGIDEVNFKHGLIFALIALALTVGSSILSAAAGKTIFDDLLSGLYSIATACVTLCVVRGIGVLAEKLGNQAMASKGRRLYIFYAVLLIASAVLRFVSGILGNKPGFATVVLPLVLVAAIGSVVAYVIYLIYLAQAKKMLAEN